MPNHFTTELCVTGPPEDLREFINRLPPMVVWSYETVVTADGMVDIDAPRERVKKTLELPMFTCETFVPMPESLGNDVQLPGEFADWMADPDVDQHTKDRWTAVMLGEVEADHDFYRPPGVISIQSKHPIAVARQAENTTRYGAPYWYEWCYQNWGTKWDTYEHDPDCTELNADEFHTRFQTAWGPPVPAIVAASLQHPTLTFTVGGWDEFEDPSDHPLVIIRNGQEI